MKLLTKIINKISLFLGWFGVACIAGMMFLTAFDLVSRSLFKYTMNGVIEIMQIFFCVTLYAGLAYCQTRHNHIHVTFLITKFPGKSKYLIWGIESLIDACVGLVVTYASFLQTGVIKGRYTLLLWIPYFPFYVFATICMLVFSLVLFLDAAKSFLALTNPEYAKEVDSTWVS